MKGLSTILFLFYAILIALLFLLKPEKEKQDEDNEAKIQVVDADTEEPIEGAKVKITTTDEECEELTLKTDEDGECTFEYSDEDATVTSIIASKRDYERARVEEMEMAYFKDDVLIIPLKKLNVIEEGREIGAQGKLKITLLWQDETVDLDLHVVQPSGKEICYLEGYQNDPDTGGALDVDWIPGNPNNIGENIFWQTPPQGQYKIIVECFNPEEAPAADAVVIVYREGQEPQKFDIQTAGYKDRQQVATITIP